MMPSLASRPTLLAAILLGTALPAITACVADGPPPPPVPGGRIHTLAIGHYTCEMPGDATGVAGRPVPESSFRVVNASSYKAGGMRGSYLYTGNRVVMTGGKLKGLTLHRISEGFLREIAADGSDGDMRCVLTSRK
ncbi:hypothetical protein [Novosphingobium malaysiense]|uniref:Elongation factor P n=1 Tax=Novosphingobium malaysiense TaxID=1348853 RepID=A0A0B1ZJD4_9SPHN|nr:hypothetical protein [Novosphingobium malaysiense]KHK91210.1 hypothetical protein LK12_09910 [Novosphingobium malaysiense]